MILRSYLTMSLIILSCLAGCIGRQMREIEASLKTAGNLNSRSFSFSISPISLKNFHDKDLQRDSNIPMMTKGEVKILERLLKQKHYCYNSAGKLDYNIINRQGQIVESMVYKYRGQEFDYQQGVAPIIYYGKCN